MNTKLNHNPDWPKLARQANWSVTKLAKLRGVSARTLERHFLKSMSKPPKEWLAEERHRFAVELLWAGRSVKEIAYRLGYEQPSNFTRQFSKHCGDRPSEFVKRRKNTTFSGVA